MKKTLARVACVVVGALLIAEVALPARLETSRVRLHATSDDFATKQPIQKGTTYRLALTDPALSDCEVREETFRRLKDGDEVSVKRSAILRTCFYIASRDGLVDTTSEPRLAFGLGGGLLLLVGLGVLPLSLLKDEEN